MRLFGRNDTSLFAMPAEIGEIQHFCFHYRVGNYMYGYGEFVLELYEDGYAVKVQKVGSGEVCESAVGEGLARKLESFLREKKVGRWNGFDGNDKFVLDGKDFSLNVRFADGSRLEARGYAVFPKDFGEVRDGLEEMFLPYASEDKE